VAHDRLLVRSRRQFGLRDVTPPWFKSSVWFAGAVSTTACVLCSSSLGQFLYRDCLPCTLRIWRTRLKSTTSMNTFITPHRQKNRQNDRRYNTVNVYGYLCLDTQLRVHCRSEETAVTSAEQELYITDDMDYWMYASRLKLKTELLRACSRFHVECLRSVSTAQ